MNAVVRVPVLIEDEEVARVLDLYGARPGDHILVRPEEDPPVTVLRYFQRDMLPAAARLLGALPTGYLGDMGPVEAGKSGRRLKVVR